MFEEFLLSVSFRFGELSWILNTKYITERALTRSKCSKFFIFCRNFNYNASKHQAEYSVRPELRSPDY